MTWKAFLQSIGTCEMRRVILESPYAGTSKNPVIARLQRWRNIRYARACIRDSLLKGEAPIASHLLYTQPDVLNDNILYERQHGIEAGLAWRNVDDASVVYNSYAKKTACSLDAR